MNKPFTHEQVRKLPIGFTPTTEFLGTWPNKDGDKIPVYAKNRKERRMKLSVKNRDWGRMSPMCRLQSVNPNPGKRQPFKIIKHYTYAELQS